MQKNQYCCTPSFKDYRRFLRLSMLIGVFLFFKAIIVNMPREQAVQGSSARVCPRKKLTHDLSALV